MIRIGQHRQVFLAACCVFVTFVSRPDGASAAHVTYEAKGYSFDYPDAWHLDEQDMVLGGPVTLMSYPKRERRHGGFLPPGGMEINVQVFSRETDENDILVLAGDTHVHRSVQAIAHCGVLRSDFDYAFTDSVTYHGTVMLVHVSAKLFRIMLVYEHISPDAAETAMGEAALVQIISTLSTQGSK